MPMLTVNVLGGLALKYPAEELVQMRSRKAEALLVYVLLSEKEAFEREELATLFWEDMPEQEALTNLRVTLAAVKKAVPDALVISRRRVSFNPEARVSCDALALSSVTRDHLGEDYSRTEQSLENCRLITAELGKYKGDFLQGFFIRNALAFDDWASYKREILRNTLINSAQIIIGNFYRFGEHREGITLANQLLFLDPFNEAAYQWLIKLYAADGQRDAALSLFEKYRQILTDELGVEPDQEISAPEDKSAEPRLPVRNNIPLQICEFFGREHELEQLRGLLRSPQVRLITLIGQGGAGKTRLAVQAARQNLSLFPDGVWFVPLEGVVSADLVLPEIYKQLRIVYPEKTRAADLLVDFLNGHRILLVLDNFEHVLDASAIISEVIRQTRNSKFLVTSREMTGLPEETNLTIEGLRTCPDEIKIDKEASPAAAFFIDRARRARPDFHPDPDDEKMIEEICDLVAGLPLGIELAASGIKQHVLRELRDYIAADVAFLRSDEPGQPERQRSLSAVFNAFWEQLSTEERLLLARLSVFQGVVTQEAARKVADASAFFLGGLVSRGLLQRALPKGYRSHSMHRKFVYERLKENEEEFRITHIRHRDFYLTFLKQMGNEIRDNPQVNLLDDIEFEIHNLRAALAFSIEEKDEQTALEFCEMLMPFWKIRGYYQEGYHWLKQTFDLDTNANQVMKASSLTAAAKLVSVLGDYAEAEQFSQRSLSIAREIGDQHLIARALNSLGAVATASGDGEMAQSYFGQSLDIYKNLRVEQAIAGTEVNLAIVNINNGKLEEARDALNKALATFRNVGDSIGIIQVLHNRARIDLLRGNHAGARELLQEALERSWGLNARNELAAIYLLLAELHILKGEDQSGLHLLSLIDELMKGYSIAFPPHEQQVYEDIRNQLRKKLPPATFNRYWQDGREASEAEIVRRYIKTAI